MAFTMTQLTPATPGGGASHIAKRNSLQTVDLQEHPVLGSFSTKPAQLTRTGLGAELLPLVLPPIARPRTTGLSNASGRAGSSSPFLTIGERPRNSPKVK